MKRTIYTSIFLFLTVCLPIASALLCYGCADSSGEEGYSACQHNIAALQEQRIAYESGERSIKDLHQIKNCSVYIDEDLNEVLPFCMIEVVKAHGNVNSFIRECSDLKSFSQLEGERLQAVKADNLSVCSYSQLHVAVICVRVCNTDFCNGPNTGSAVQITWMLFIALVAWATSVNALRSN